jgi:hypothetical protein
LLAGACDDGAGFVTVAAGFVWDMHADVANAPLAESSYRQSLDPRSQAASTTSNRGLDDKKVLRGLQGR